MRLPHLTVKPSAAESGDLITTKRKTLPHRVVSSMGMVIPFQPSLWNESTIKSMLGKSTQMVQAKMTGIHNGEFTDNILLRLEKLFAQLNYNTHRKGLAVILTQAHEQVIYLNFPVKPLVYFSKQVTLLDLVSAIRREPDFYYFIFHNNKVCLYEYCNRYFRKVYEKQYETNMNNLFKKASSAMELLNGNSEKPVFVTGCPHQSERFCSQLKDAEIIFRKDGAADDMNDEAIHTHIQEIKGHWRYWRSRFLAGRVLLAQRHKNLTRNIEAVLPALTKGVNGLLLIEKRLEQQLLHVQKGHGVFQLAKEMMIQLDKFLQRGNRFEIVETGLLKDLGEIVLLGPATRTVPGKQVAVRNRRNDGFLY